MALTAQEIVDKAGWSTKRERTAAVKSATEGLKKELALEAQAKKDSIAKFKAAIKRPLTSKVSSDVRRVDKKIGRIARKAISLVTPKTSLAYKLTKPPSKKVPGRSRGRPKQTYKTRVLPSGKIVKVPTSIYNKMLAQEKAAIRLAAAQRKAIITQQRQVQMVEAEQIAMQQDPRFQRSAEDAWVESEDFEHQAEVQRVNQQQAMLAQMYQQQQMQQPSMVRRAGEMFGKAKITLMGGQSQPQQYPQQYPGQYPQAQSAPATYLQRPQLNMDIQRPVNPQVIVMGGKSNMFGGRGNIMDQKNEFNETNRATIGFGR